MENNLRDDRFGSLLTKAQIQNRINDGIKAFLSLGTSPEHEREIADVMRKTFIADRDIYSCAVMIQFMMLWDTFQTEMFRIGYPEPVSNLAAGYIQRELLKFPEVKEIYEKAINQKN